MTELDFDELDKAVNSLMNKGGVVDKDAGAVTKTLDIGETLAPDEPPTYNNLRQAAEKIGSEAIDHPEKTVSLTDPSVASRRTKGGRYMDVVHSSSDMRSPARGEPVSRHGKTLTAPEELQFPSSEEPESIVIDTTAGNLPASSEQLDDDKIETNSLPEPLSSPFIPDAKVEKRPLGGAGDSPVTIPPSEFAASESKSSLPSYLSTQDHDEEQEVELLEAESASVLEGSSKMDAQDQAAMGFDEMTAHVPEEFKDDVLAVEQAGVAPVAEEHTSEDTSQPFGAASIPKQYQEKPNTGDASNGSIYDTTNYHKPFLQPTKQRSTLKWVLISAVIILTGAGVGAVVFFFVR